MKSVQAQKYRIEIRGDNPTVVFAAQDIKDLPANGFDGYVGCQVLRCFWPTGLGMKVIAETLWNVDKPYAAIRREHLQEWFGAAATTAGKALDGMYQTTAGLLPAHGECPPPESLRESCQTLGKIAASLRRAAKNVVVPTIRQRLGFLADHADYLADQLLTGQNCSQSDADKEAAKDRLKKFFTQRIKDAEFLIDAQYHGKPYLPQPVVRK